MGGFGSGTPSFREPGFRATSVRHPALLVRVSVPAEFGRRERDCPSGPTTFWDLGLEIRRAADGQPLLVEPPAEDLRAVDAELDCKTGRLIRRKSMDELITDSVGLVLAPFSSR